MMRQGKMLCTKSSEASRPVRTVALVVLLILSSIAPSTDFTINSAAADWSPLGQPVRASTSIFVSVDASKHALNPSLAFSNTRPYLGWIESNTQGVSQIYVSHWNGSAWASNGGSQNMDATHRAYDMALASNGKIPYLAWIELNRNGTPQLYLKHLIEDQWILDGGSLNRDSGQPAANPAMAVSESAGYLAWSESNPKRIFQLYVKRQDGNGWEPDGEGGLNINPSRDAIEPALALEGSVPYLAWMELSDHHFYQIYVRRRESSGWEILGRSLNNDPTTHALSPSMTLVNKVPHVAWTEIDADGVSQLFVKRWENGSWASLGGSLNTDPRHHAISPSLMKVGGMLYLAWTEYDDKSHPRIHISRWAGQRWELVDPHSDGAHSTTVSSSPSLAALGAVPFAAWKEVSPNGLFSIVVKRLQTK